MKKINLILGLMLAISFALPAQEKGSYITGAGTLGLSGFQYNLEGGSEKSGLGYGGVLGYQYFFNRHWGVSAGVGISFYTTTAKYDDKSFVYKNQLDNEQDVYDLTLRLRNWEEKQEGYFLEIPVMAMYQHKFGEKQRHGIYAGLGVKVQIPNVIGTSTFSIEEGSNLQTSAYYPEWNLVVGGDGNPDVSAHSYGSTESMNDMWASQSRDNELNVSFAVAGEAGFLFGLSRRVDLTVGAYMDYGVNNIQKQDEDPLISPVPNVAQQDGQVGELINYKGVINSNAVDRVNLMSVGAKVGVRVKLGKLKEKTIDAISMEPARVDTVTVYERDTVEIIREVPVPVPVPVEEPKKVGVTQDEKTILMEPIFFDLDEHVLKPASTQALDRKVEILKKYPEMTIRIIGNTCDIGTNDYNAALGQKRAEVARDYLYSKGIGLNRMTTISEGAKNPLVPNSSGENHLKNRRDDFRINE